MTCYRQSKNNKNVVGKKLNKLTLIKSIFLLLKNLKKNLLKKDKFKYDSI